MEEFTRKLNICSNCKKFLWKCRSNTRMNSLTSSQSQPHAKVTDSAEYFFTFPLSHLPGPTESVLVGCPVHFLSSVLLASLFYPYFPFPPRAQLDSTDAHLVETPGISGPVQPGKGGFHSLPKDARFGPSSK